jgi:hypothetical protein
MGRMASENTEICAVPILKAASLNSDGLPGCGRVSAA